MDSGSLKHTQQVEELSIFIQPFNKQLLSIYSMLSTVLGDGHSAVNKTIILKAFSIYLLDGWMG